MKSGAAALSRRVTHHHGRAIKKAEIGNNARTGGALATAAGLALMPFDGGATAMTALALGAAASAYGDRKAEQAEFEKGRAELAKTNVEIIGRLTRSVNDLVEAVELVGTFVTTLENELAELAKVGKGSEFRKMHWVLMKGKASAVVDSCRAFISVRPVIESDLRSIKEDLEEGYRVQWDRKFQQYQLEHERRV
jgi:hypothetical protein